MSERLKGPVKAAMARTVSLAAREGLYMHIVVARRTSMLKFAVIHAILNSTSTIRIHAIM